MPSTLFIANWKMQKPLKQSIAFCEQNLDALKALSADTKTEIVLCPSYPALYPLNELLADTMVHIGGQNCSSHISGAYTGDVSARSLSEAGCNYCIIGHSEQRSMHQISDEAVAQAALHLSAESIEPVICIGETKEQFEKNEGKVVVEKQLDPILTALKESSQPLSIAYEPVWAIGTGIIPEHNYLSEQFARIASYVGDALSMPWRLIYGGSVSPENVTSLKTIPHLSGFLIGSASLDFQKFQKIVSLGK